MAKTMASKFECKLVGWPNLVESTLNWHCCRQLYGTVGQQQSAELKVSKHEKIDGTVRGRSKLPFI